jgi:putative toxin-antitoxin system antitoxin component (TIGR02293 family)
MAGLPVGVSSRAPMPVEAGALLRLKAKTAAELREAVRKGMPFGVFAALSKHLEMSLQEVADVAGIPPRTVARRKTYGTLDPQESDRVYRLARVVAQAARSLGSLEKARAWLKAPNRALAGEVPLGLLDTDIGARQVEEVLLRLDHGIFS